VLTAETLRGTTMHAVLAAAAAQTAALQMLHGVGPALRAAEARAGHLERLVRALPLCLCAAC
jgi:hypothetical protein